MYAITASGLTTKWINAHTVSNVDNVAATTTLRQNVKRKNKLMLKCGYCRIEGHKIKECETRREEEKTEKVNYRKTQQMKIKTLWQERAKFTEKSKK